MKLSELALISAGQGAPQGESAYGTEGIPFIKAGDLASLLAGKKESEIQHVNESVAKKHKLKLYPAGSILFAKSGMSCMKGYVYKTENPCYVVSHLAIISTTRCNADFLKYYFQFHKPNSLVKDAAYPSISLADIGEMEINLPTQAEQQKIVNKLEKATELIALRKEQLAKLDQLVKSRFIELFENANHPRVALIDLIKEGAGLSYGIVQPGDDGTGDMGVLRPVDMVDGRISTASIKYINRSIGDGFRKTELTGDELLITVRGTTGITALTDSRFRGMNVTRGIAVIRYDRNKIDPVYLNAYLNTQESQRYIQEHTRGATLQQINLSDLRIQEIMLPPMDQQRQLAAFVEQTDKSKLAVQKALEELEILKKSLMQQYFG